MKKRKRRYRMRMVMVKDGKELPLAKTIKPITKETLGPSPTIMLPSPKKGYEYSFDSLSSHGVIEVRKKKKKREKIGGLYGT